MLNHCQFAFNHKINIKLKDSFSARPRSRRVDVSSVVCTLMENSRLAYQFATLQPTVVKINFLGWFKAE